MTELLTDRELDIKIAEKVMGWRWLNYTTSRPRPCRVLCSPNVTSLENLPIGFEQLSGPTTEDECNIEPPIMRVGCASLPHYTTAEWMLIVEKMRELEYVVSIYGVANQFMVSFDKESRFGENTITNESIGRAVCESALFELFGKL